MRQEEKNEFRVLDLKMGVDRRWPLKEREGSVIDSLLIALQRRQGVGAVESDWKIFCLRKQR